jgi:hypothetical protein
MTRRKDKIRAKKKEIQLLENIRELPTELIRIIYSYMTGNAKMLCNYKFDYLNYIFIEYHYPMDFMLHHIEYFINKLPKKDILNLIYKGVLRNYPNILENISDTFYRRDIQEKVYISDGYQLFQLWENNVLEVAAIYDLEDDLEDDLEEKNRKVDLQIIGLIVDNIRCYIENTIETYRYETKKLLIKKNWKVSYIPFRINSILVKPAYYYSLKNLDMLKLETCKHTLFLTIDKLFHLYKCLDDLMFMKNYICYKYWRD